jgi:cardiolipin synthase
MNLDRRIYIIVAQLFLILISLSSCRSVSPLIKTSLEPNQRTDSAFVAYLHNKGIKTTRDNQVRVLESAREKFTVMFDDISKAKHSIHLEYFNFRNDSIANLLFELLERKAQEGVEVRAIFDAFGNSSNNRPLKKRHLKVIRDKGVQIVKFDPITFPYINHVFHRDHRKIVVIDGKIGYTGGMNVADYYINGLPKIGPWRDMHIRLEGSAVYELQALFLSMWNKVMHANIQGNNYFPKIGNRKGDKQVAIVERTPKKTPTRIRRAYARAIDLAKKKILLINPYFLPTTKIRKALKHAVKRGVDVQIMFSSKSDIKFVPDAMFYLGHRFSKCGAKVYLYQGGFHHSKIMMVDDLFCTIGSTNLNSRSLRYDYEVNAFLIDTEITDLLTEMFETDKHHCVLMTAEMWRSKSLWKKFLGWFANLLTPVL